MTFLELTQQVSLNVFPEGEARRLRDVHKDYIRDGLIDLQRKVSCLQAKHYNHVPYADTYWNCGATVFDAPRGYIIGLKTIIDGDFCDEIRYDPVTKEDIECMIRGQKDACGITAPHGYYYDGYDYVDYPVYPYITPAGSVYPDDSVDKSGRSLCGWYTLHDDKVWMYPHIQSTETVILEWVGIKKDFSDSDEVSYERDVISALETYLEWKVARKEDCNLAKFQGARSEYNETVGDLIYECKKRKRLPRPKPCFSNYGHGLVTGTGCCGTNIVSSGSAATDDAILIE